MGSACSCFHVPDVENGNPICFDSWIHILKNKYRSLFIRREIAVPISNQVISCSNPPGILSNSHETLPNNPLSRVLISRTAKGAGHSRVEPEPIQGLTNFQVISKQLHREDNSFGSCFQRSSKECHSESSVKVLPVVCASLDDEDVCPTCLEEYTAENPKIITQCSHHYHLSCIFEWMERSETCPVCGKLMVFNETN